MILNRSLPRPRARVRAGVTLHRLPFTAPVTRRAQAPGAGAAAAPVEEKTSATIVLTSAGANKIQVIKEIRTITSLGLKEAKDLVESPPKPVKTGIKKEEADEIKKKLEAVGAQVQLK